MQNLSLVKLVLVLLVTGRAALGFAVPQGPMQPASDEQPLAIAGSKANSQMNQPGLVGPADGGGGGGAPPHVITETRYTTYT